MNIRNIAWAGIFLPHGSLRRKFARFAWKKAKSLIRFTSSGIFGNFRKIPIRKGWIRPVYFYRFQDHFVIVGCLFDPESRLESIRLASGEPVRLRNIEESPWKWKYPASRYFSESVSGKTGGKTELALRFKDGTSLIIPLKAMTADFDDPGFYKTWMLLNGTDRNELSLQSESKDLPRVLFSVILPVYRTPEKLLRECIESVLNQSFPHFELCIADGSGEGHPAGGILREYAEADPRVRLTVTSGNTGISANTLQAIGLAAGDFAAFLDHDDLLAPDALFRMYESIHDHPECDVFYSDEDIMSETGERLFPHFKPDFGPDTLASYNYICHFLAVRRIRGNSVGWIREGFDGAQDHDFILRLAGSGAKFCHIPRILYHWRQAKGSVASDPSAKQYAYQNGLKAVTDYYRSRGIPAEVFQGFFPGAYETRFPVRKPDRISILIPSRDQSGMLESCVRSILDKSSHPDYEILIIENGSVQTATFSTYERLCVDPRVRVLTWNQPFNYSAINNFGAESATGELLLLLNNDMKVIHPDWLERLSEHFVKPETGIAGGLLVYPDHTVQHAGIILGIGGFAGHSHKGYPSRIPGNMGRLQTVQNLSAVTGACLMIRKTLWADLSGLDERLAVALNDIDLCLRAREKGWNVVWTPYCRLIHYESKTRGYEDSPEKKERFDRELAIFMERWGETVRKGDPFYNPNLTLERENFAVRL